MVVGLNNVAGFAATLERDWEVAWFSCIFCWDASVANAAVVANFASVYSLESESWSASFEFDLSGSFDAEIDFRWFAGIFFLDADLERLLEAEEETEESE